MAVEHEHIVALRYVAVSVVPGATSGSNVYAFVFHLKTGDGAVYTLSSRYSELRKLHQALTADESQRAALPKFPPKLAMQRQTPQFLIARGRALEAYLASALGDPRLHSAPAVRQLLRTADIFKPTDAPAATPELPTPIVAPASLAGWQANALVPPPDAQRASAGMLTRLLEVAFHPLISVVLAIFLGSAYDDMVLCVACCLLGLFTGHLIRSTSATSVPTIAAPTNGAGRHHDRAPPPPAPAAHGTIGEAPVAPPVAASAIVASASSAPTGQTDPIDAAACREALVALGELNNAVRSAHEPPFAAAHGWKLTQTKDDVNVHINARPDGPTWGMGHGPIDAPPSVLLPYVDADDAKLDKQLIKYNVIRQIPKQAIALPDGWEVVRLQLQQSLYKSPAWPVGPRESCTVKLTARRTMDGALQTIQRSVDVPGVEPPSGYVRVNLTCGGYDIKLRADGHGCDVTYVNILDPNGSIPRSVVNFLVPDRAMVVARLRKLLIAP